MEHISRRIEVDGKRLFVLDGVFRSEDVASVYDFVRRHPYRLNDFDSNETAYSMHWKTEFPLLFVDSNEVFRRSVELAHELMRPGSYQLARVHANLHLYGDMQFPHQDLADGVTALYYANPDWDEKWLGETIFYDEAREPLYAVAPRPGRLVVFDANILHRGGVPSRECHAPRISIAFKFVPQSA